MVRDWEREWEMVDIIRGDGFIKEELVIVLNVVVFLSWRREGFERGMGINVDKSYYWEIDRVGLLWKNLNC